MPSVIQDLVAQAVAGSVRPLSRLISMVEDQESSIVEVYDQIYPYTGRAHVIGITGPPGSGKSTLVDKIVGTLRKAGKTCGIVAVDPTSPFTGGAILGDRIRMQRHGTDDGVFIRSMGTRGHLGGISRGTSGAVDLLDAAGYDYVIVETVGVGQSEVEIASIADTVVLVMVPGLGDDIQVIKAGIMEIGDIFVVNKKDRPGADRTKAELIAALDMAEPHGRRPPVVSTMAESGEGVEDLSREILAHFAHLRDTNALVDRRVRRAQVETARILVDRLRMSLEVELAPLVRELSMRIALREISPYRAADELHGRLLDKEVGR